MKKYCVLLRTFLILLGTVATGVASAQGDSTKLFPWKLHLQSRFSLAEGSLVGTWGVSAGYVWGPYERELTVGYHWLGARGNRQLGQIEKELARESALDSYNSVQAGFVNVGYWHIVHNTRRWKWGFPIELGVGKATARPHSLLDEPLPAEALTSTILPLQLAGYGEWKATRWVGIGLQAGYRQNLIRFAAAENLSGPYGRLRVLVYPATYVDWLRFIFKKKPLPSPFYKKQKSTP
ncbi:hypothetical protein [Salmonirosea aquatica]|uniref:DUF3575 domain-containing protein n=1 Tax=Salmonirosea aquatica TaxID=2654236 RepID=A0A7C9BST6_9BACT|nr:hypothetical protein [Cytophagaceae bacterium SJW1-29]